MSTEGYIIYKLHIVPLTSFATTSLRNGFNVSLATIFPLTAA